MRFPQAVPAPCARTPHLLTCPAQRTGILGLGAPGMAPVCQGYQGTRTCPQHRQVRHLGTSNSRSESALGWRQSPCPEAAYGTGIFSWSRGVSVSNVKPSFLCCSRGPALCFCPSHPAAASLLGPGSLWFPCDSSLEAGIVVVIVFLAGDKTGPS